MKRIGIILLAVLLCCSAVSCRGKTENTLLTLHFLDVGQGDAILLRTSEGDILVDAGTEDAQELLCLRLEQLGVKELALAVFTHPDEDHIGGADGVLSRFPTKEVWTNGAPMTNESARRMLAVAEEKGVAVRSVQIGEIRRFGEVLISVLAPIGSVSEAGNEGSVVLKVNCGKINAILTGDIGVEQEAELVSHYGASQLACDIYKVAHHGSNTSSSAAFLQAMQPTYAVIGCGAANSYGHPMGEVLSRLEAIGATVLRTDLLGEVVFRTDGETLLAPSK